MRSGLFLPLFDELANPALVAKLAAAAEEAGWHRVFVWDHVRWREPVVDVADPCITLTAIAIASRPYGHAARPAQAGQSRPGNRDTGSAQRWPAHTRGRPGQRPCRTRALDHRRRNRRQAARPHAGRVPANPDRRLVRSTRPPPRRALHGRRHAVPAAAIAAAGCSSVGRRLYGNPAPLRRAARYQGFIAVNLEDADQLAEIVAELTALRRAAGSADTQPYDTVVAVEPGCDPAPYAAAGATWWLVGVAADAARADLVRAIIRDGPAGSA
jgi:hypothetical protein